MTDELKIRDYSSRDKSDVLEILRLNTPDYFSPDEEAGFIKFLDQEIEIYYVTTLNEKIIGCGGINFNENQTKAFISWGMIHPDYQRKSIGSALLQYRIEKLRAMKQIECITVRTSQMVYKFYERNGFEIKEVVKDYWAKGFDLYSLIYQNE